MPASRALQVHRNNQRRASLRDGLLYPLDLLYERAGVAPPLVKRIAADRIPAPYSGLLVHQNEMTSTLEGHFGAEINLDQEWRNNGQNLTAAEFAVFYTW